MKWSGDCKSSVELGFFSYEAWASVRLAVVRDLQKPAFIDAEGPVLAEEIN